MRWFLILLACRALTVNDVTSGESTDYPELRSVQQPIPPSRLLKHAEQTAAQMPGWTGCARKGRDGLQCQGEGPLGLGATITIEVQRVGPMLSRLVTRVASDSPMGDLGYGAEQIEAFHAALAGGAGRGGPANGEP